MKSPFLIFSLFAVCCSVSLSACQTPASGTTTRSGRQWEKITLQFQGPSTGETEPENPFLDYRLEVSFTHEEKTYTVPGFFAADGNAAESSAEKGNIWAVRFRPDEEGEWDYKVSFRQGKDIAVSDDPQAGKGVAFDGESGTIQVAPAASGVEGRLQYTGERYLKYAGSGRYFIKGGADSPENFLAYEGFDGTWRGRQPENREGEATAREELHRYAPHLGDWKEGDPTWHTDQGKGIIGALNYLASKGMNSVYFLTMNIEGDGKDVWPYTGYEERFRFDCSKLDQWEIVFDHMDKLGLMLHIVLQETENERLLDDGDTRYARKLYYRELIARFAHHLRITWNMGEENGPAGFSPNGQTTAQQKAMIKYFKEHDPYQNFVVIHTHSDNELRREMFEKLVGDENLDGISIQVGQRAFSHAETKYWIGQSARAGKQWVVTIDEIGHHSRGVDPDDRVDNNQDSVRAEVLWGNLMAGGGGVEWYFGYRNHNNDLQCEDWRSRDRLWEYTRHALDFFENYLPFPTMVSQDNLISGGNAYCFAQPGEVYAVYLPFGGSCTLDLEERDGQYTVEWYNPRRGGQLQRGSVSQLSGGKKVKIGLPPAEPEQDWAVLINKKP